LQTSRAFHAADGIGCEGGRWASAFQANDGLLIGCEGLRTHILRVGERVEGGQKEQKKR
jgi:hypothetical protein